MSENNLEELWSILEATDAANIEEPSSYTLLSGLELPDVFFDFEANAYPQLRDNLDDFKLSSTDVGALWNVPDVTLPALTTSVPSSTSHTESDSGCSYEQHPSPTTLPSSLSNSVDSLSPTESLVQSPKQIYPKINITYGQSNKLNSKKGQVNVQSESVLSNQSPKCFVGCLINQELSKLQDTQEREESSLNSLHDEDTKTDCDEDSKAAYIKKPPNAFMLFMMEQRPKISKKLWCEGSSNVNSYLASIWRSLSDQEQSTYFNRAAQLKQIHKINNPTWSTRLNYGKKRYRGQKYRVSAYNPTSYYLNPGQPMQCGFGLPTYLPQPPYGCSLPQQGPLIQAPFPQGYSMFIHPYMPGMQAQNPPLWIHTQGPCLQNSQIQAHAPQAPYFNPCPPQGFMRIPDEGVYTLNPPTELRMESTVVGPVPDQILEEQ